MHARYDHNVLRVFTIIPSIYAFPYSSPDDSEEGVNQAHHGDNAGGAWFRRSCGFTTGDAEALKVLGNARCRRQKGLIAQKILIV